jgi:hypothetical protein
MSLERVVAGSEILGAILLLVLFAIGVRNRSYLREIGSDPDRAWRVLARFAVFQLALFIAWTSLFDNWRQLTAIPFRAMKQYPSERIQIDPPSHGVRAVTFALLAVSLVLLAALFARHVGGYFLQLTLIAGALAAWFPFFVIRTRFSLNLALGFTGSWRSPVDVTGYAAFLAITYLFDIGLIAISFVVLLGVVALPVTLVLDLTRTRRPRVSGEAKPFFASISDRASSVRRA